MSTSNPVFSLVPARAAFVDGVLFSEQFGDIYHSVEGAVEQARHVFIGGNELPQRWRAADQFTIVETGFGCGLNFLATWDEFARCGASGRLDYVSVEKHPFTRDNLETILSAWPQFVPNAHALVDQYPPLIAGFHRRHFAEGRVTLTLLFGDAVEMLSELDGGADAFFLDGFAPSKNPDMWSNLLFQQLERLARPGATAATYSVAGSARRGLEAVGFNTAKRPGFATKREMLVARYLGRRQVRDRCRKVVVVGAGIAGASCAFALARRGVDVDLLDRCPCVGASTSSNPAAVVRPFVTRASGTRDRFAWAAFGYATSVYRQLTNATDGAWQQTGVLQLGRDTSHFNKLVSAIEEQALTSNMAQIVDARVASVLTGVEINESGIWFPEGGIVAGTQMCQTMAEFERSRIQFAGNVDVQGLCIREATVDVLGAKNHVVASGDIVVIANGTGVPELLANKVGPLRLIRGQVTGIETRLPQLRAPVCREGYVTPALGRYHYVGGTFDKSSTKSKRTEEDQQANLLRAAHILPNLFDDASLSADMAWVGVRVATRDRLPLIGRLQNRMACSAAMGSRGFSWAPLAGEIIASNLTGAPCPLEQSVARDLLPERFEV